LANRLLDRALPDPTATDQLHTASIGSAPLMGASEHRRANSQWS
jgi:hypothetical protein